MKSATKFKIREPNFLLKTSGIILALISISLLLYAFLKAGIFYILDNDELSHVQVGYLINAGFTPYRDFFSIYPPLFGWFLSLILRITGETAAAFPVIRSVMTGLFLIRLFLIYALAKKIFNPAVALIAIILYLCDPFNSFTAIQIRPDNLMLTFFLGSIFFAGALSGKNKVAGLFIHALLLVLSVLTLPKIVPQAVIIFIITLVYLYRHKLKGLIPLYLSTVSAVILTFILPFAANGLLPELTQNTIIDPPKTNEALQYPTRLGTFYLKNINYGFYGHNTVSATWRFIWILPLMAFAGLGVALSHVLEKKSQTLFDYLAFALILSLIGQFSSLLFINSVFIQYYIPILWLYAVFAAFFIWHLANQLTRNRCLFSFYLQITVILFAIVAKSAYTGNLNRALIRDNTPADIDKILNNTAPNQKTFPNAMFRPFSYPFPYGYFYGDIPREIRNRYQPLRNYIERDRLPFLYINQYLFNYFDYEDREYIKTHYTFSDNIWVRNGN